MRYVRDSWLLAIACALAPTSLAAQAAPPLWQGLEPGPHPVGWRAVSRVDDDRAFACGSDREAPGRPVRLFVWYPAAVSDPPALRFRDYVEVSSGDPDAYERALVERDLSTVHRQFSPVDSTLTRALLDTPVHARASVPEAPGQHPLVVHALGRNDYQQEATVLWEHLASHGYVVVVPPQMGPCPESPRLEFDARSIAVQAADVVFAIDVAASWSWVDASRVAIVGHSSGAVVALEAAADPRVRAIVSLDGSIATAEGGTLLREMGTAPVNAPVLDLRAAGNPARDDAVLETLTRGPLVRGVFGTGKPPRQATHFDFQNWPLYATLLDVEDERGAPFRPPAFGRDVWLAAIRLTRAFLDDALARDGDGILERWRSDAPEWLRGVATIDGLDTAPIR